MPTTALYKSIFLILIVTSSLLNDMKSESVNVSWALSFLIDSDMLGEISSLIMSFSIEKSIASFIIDLSFTYSVMSSYNTMDHLLFYALNCHIVIYLLSIARNNYIWIMGIF